jgi:predicted PurR-regulated permease PerM
MAENATPSHPLVQQPAYQKLSLIMLGLVAFIFALNQAQSILLPLLFALLLAMLLNPLVNRMTRKRVPRILAIFLAVLLAMACAAGLSYFILTQAANFSETLPELRQKVAALGISIRDWVENKTPIAPGAVNDALLRARESGLKEGGKLLSGALLTMGTVFAFLFLLPVFTFLILLYKRLLLTFIIKLFPDEHRGVVQDVLQGSKGVTQHYLVGLMIQSAILATMNYVGLLIIGLEFALLLAVIAAVLNLIPYIGMLMASLGTMIIALATADLSTALWVVALFAGVQFIDNNIVVPNVVASRVELNALVSIIVVMIGGAIWGIPGMFLAIPLSAIAKVIFDRVPSLEPFGYVLGSGDGPAKEPDPRTRWALPKGPGKKGKA